MTVRTSIRALRGTCAPWLGLLLVPALGTLLHVTRGAFMPWAVPALLAGTLCWTIVVVGAEPTPRGRFWCVSVISALVCQAVVVARDPAVIYVHVPLRANVLKLGLELFVAVGALSLVTAVHPVLKGALEPGLFRGSVVFLFAARLSVLAISPAPYIDVFTSGTLGAQHFWAGNNPYEQVYPDIYGGVYAYNPVFFYGPVYVVLSALAFVLGDIRWATILADALGGTAMLRFGLDPSRGPARRALTVLWLAFPVYLFVLEQGWVDPIVFAALAWSLWACVRRRFWLAGACAGLALGVKQTAILMMLLTLVWALRVAGFRNALRYALGAALTTALFYGPYLLWNPSALYSSLVTNIMQAAPRLDALSLRAWLAYLQLGTADAPLRWVSITLIVATGVWLWRYAQSLADLTSCAVLCYMVAFLCGFQAFCNYYSFVASLIVLDLLARTDWVEWRAAEPSVSML